MFLFSVGVNRCHKDQLKVQVQFHVAGSSVLAFKVTVQVKKTLIGPTPNSHPFLPGSNSLLFKRYIKYEFISQGPTSSQMCL